MLEFFLLCLLLKICIKLEMPKHPSRNKNEFIIKPSYVAQYASVCKKSSISYKQVI